MRFKTLMTVKLSQLRHTLISCCSDLSQFLDFIAEKKSWSIKRRLVSGKLNSDHSYKREPNLCTSSEFTFVFQVCYIKMRILVSKFSVFSWEWDCFKNIFTQFWECWMSKLVLGFVLAKVFGQEFIECLKKCLVIIKLCSSGSSQF